MGISSPMQSDHVSLDANDPDQRRPQPFAAQPLRFAEIPVEEMHERQGELVIGRVENREIRDTDLPLLGDRQAARPAFQRVAFAFIAHRFSPFQERKC
jgi:hypothetical protein